MQYDRLSQQSLGFLSEYYILLRLHFKIFAKKSKNCEIEIQVFRLKNFRGGGEHQKFGSEIFVRVPAQTTLKILV